MPIGCSCANKRVLDYPQSHSRRVRERSIGWVEAEKAKLDEVERDQITIAFKVDEEVKMGIVSDVEQKLRDANARKILYKSLKNVVQN